MLIAQITDIHLGFDPDDPAELNRRRLDAVIAALLALDPLPDLLLATGDLSETGAPASYRTLKSVFDALPFPVLPALGNHDDRANFLSVFADTPAAGGFVQYAVEAGPLRIVVLDTLDAGRQTGGFDAARAAWLAAALAEADRPTLLVLHHPPIDTGNGWMTENAGAAWIARLRAIVAVSPRVIGIVAGHVHRGVVAGWAGTVVTACPSCAPQLAHDFSPLDPDRPDGRAMIVAEPPGFALHRWDGSALVTHFGGAGSHDVLARYDSAMQPVVRQVLAEWREG